MGQRKTLKIKGKKHLKVYRATVRNPRRPSYKSGAERWFCGECGAHLYLLDDDYPDGIWPNAGIIDTPLPIPPERTHIMLQWKPKWIPVEKKGLHFRSYPDTSIEDWHKSHRLTKR